MATGDNKTTTDHDVIRQWIQERGGKPAGVRDTGGGGDPGILRVEFPGQGSDEDLEELGWDEFFDKFEANNLAFIYQDTTADGELSRFFKFIQR